MLLKASAPGSLMLLGEYAVLHGKHALACALDQRMTVQLQPRSDKKISIQSALGQLETDIDHLEVTAPFQFVLTALKSFKKHLRSGCDLVIESEFSSTIGFGSSAAVTVATVAVVAEWLKLSMTQHELIRHARKVVRAVQGLGSGADVAACVLGGVVAYRMQPLVATQLPFTFPLTVVYSGSKTPTVTAVNFIQKKFATQPDIFSALLSSINQCVLAGMNAVQQQNWQQLGEIFNMQQGMMDALGVNTVALRDIIHVLRQQKNIAGAKISGSGLGDCAIALGNADMSELSLPADATWMPVAMTPRGVYCEKI